MNVPVQGVPADNASANSESAPIQGRFLSQPFADAEIIFGLVAAVGTDLGKVRSVLEDRLKVLGYIVTHVRITTDVIPVALGAPAPSWKGELERLRGLMDAGDEVRKRSGDNSVLALGAAALINSQRSRDADDRPQHEPKRAYIISSLKHPDEVTRLRDIYPLGFYLIGVHSDEQRRFSYLTKDKGISTEDADRLMRRDADEDVKYGQKLIKTFHLSDFFVRIEGQEDRLKQSVWRIRPPRGARPGPGVLGRPGARGFGAAGSGSARTARARRGVPHLADTAAGRTSVPGAGWPAPTHGGAAGTALMKAHQLVRTPTCEGGTHRGCG
jgi:hypothetical protein